MHLEKVTTTNFKKCFFHWQSSTIIISLLIWKKILIFRQLARSMSDSFVCLSVCLSVCHTIFSEVLSSIIMIFFHMIPTLTRTEPIKFERSSSIDDVTKNRQSLKKRHSFTWSELSKNHISVNSQSISLQFDVAMEGHNIFHCANFHRDRSTNVTSRNFWKLNWKVHLRDKKNSKKSNDSYF